MFIFPPSQPFLQEFHHTLPHPLVSAGMDGMYKPLFRTIQARCHLSRIVSPKILKSHCSHLISDSFLSGIVFKEIIPCY